MVEFTGIVKGKIRHPYIYVIKKGYCLYIGETQRHPVLRWGEHLTPVGSFMQKLKNEDQELWMKDIEILFLCFECEKISSLPSIEQELVTKYVEHKLHEFCVLNLPILKDVEKIISDTIKTAPSRCVYKWCSELAEKIFSRIVFFLGVGNTSPAIRFLEV